MAALVLAGGRGERLGGVRKGQLKFGGERLVDRAAERLARHCAPVVISTGALAPELLGLPTGTVPLPDLDVPVAGPLAGVVAMAEWIERQENPFDVVVSLAVDTPFVPDDFVTRLVVEIGGAAAVYATSGDSFYPTNAAWRRATLGALLARVRSGAPPRSLRAFLEEIQAVAVDWPNTNGDPFANVNTLADLLALERRGSGLR
jgi:molybdopterin-guanine dinucleotide biosynthesis protein A